MDYVFDLRSGSPTYGHHIKVRLSADVGDQLFVPVGYGHAFVTLEADVEVTYKVSAPYAPGLEGGLLWNDPSLRTEWPLSTGEAVVSKRDEEWPRLEHLETPFLHDGVPFELARFWG